MTKYIADIDEARRVLYVAELARAYPIIHPNSFDLLLKYRIINKKGKFNYGKFNKLLDNVSKGGHTD